MSELGDLLELLQGATRRWQTVRLVVRRWQDSELTRRVMDRQAEVWRSRGTRVVTSARGPGGGETTWESQTRAWIDRAGDRSRVEADGPDGESLLVHRGRLWWSYTPHMGGRSNESDPEIRGGRSQELDWLLDPSWLVAAFDFDVQGRTAVAGCPAIDVVARPRPSDRHAGLTAWLADAADEVGVAVDRERGILLRSESRFEGRPFWLTEIVEVAFDEPLADERFTFVSPDGSPVQPVQPFVQPEPVSVEEAARRAPFTVLVPTRLPRGWSLEATYLAASVRPPWPEQVTVAVLAGERREPRLWIRQGATDAVPDNLDWEEVVRGGRQILVRRTTGLGSPCEAKATIEGTHVRATGNVDRDTFLDLVASLAPAPKDLPPVVDA